MARRVVVVGGGPAGMMAAYSAASRGAIVTLIEQNEKLGKKLYITGKGRCNVTNDCAAEEFFPHVVGNAKFLYSSIYGFPPSAMMSFLEGQGCPLKVERGGRVFPVSDHAVDVTKAMERALRSVGVALRLRTRVTGFRLEEAQSGRVVRGIFAEHEGRRERIDADALILAGGGCSYASTGSDGSMLRLLQELGVAVRSPRPALVPFHVAERECAALQGLSLRNVAVQLWPMAQEDAGGADGVGVAHVAGGVDDAGPSHVAGGAGGVGAAHDVGSVDGAGPSHGKDRAQRPRGKAWRPIYEGFGEMLFTHYGVSGPLILSASSYYSRHHAGERACLAIDLKPALTHKQLDERLQRDFAQNSNKQLGSVMRGLLPGKLAELFPGLCGVAASKCIHDVTRGERLKLRDGMKRLCFTVTGTRGFDEAIVTCGGVDVGEVSASTLESKQIAGLYVAGEMLDVDAHTGGYNLQIAWATGRLAGESAGIKNQEPDTVSECEAR